MTEVIRAFGYWGVGVLTFAENAFPPIPSELIIPLAGFVAAEGDLSIAGVVAAGSTGSLAGAWVWYEVGRRIGERRLRDWVQRFGRWLTLEGSDIDRAQRWFERHGAAAVFVGRLVPGVRTFVSLPAGFAGMALGPFLLYSAVGTIVWTAALAYAGVVLRENFTLVGDYIGVVTNVVLGALGLMLARRYVRCWRTSR